MIGFGVVGDGFAARREEKQGLLNLGDVGHTAED